MLCNSYGCDVSCSCIWHLPFNRLNISRAKCSSHLSSSDLWLPIIIIIFVVVFFFFSSSHFDVMFFFSRRPPHESIRTKLIDMMMNQVTTLRSRCEFNFKTADIFNTLYVKFNHNEINPTKCWSLSLFETWCEGSYRVFPCGYRSGLKEVHFRNLMIAFTIRIAFSFRFRTISMLRC